MSVVDLPFATRVSDAAPVAILGVLCGLAGALFNRFHVQVLTPRISPFHDLLVPRSHEVFILVC